MNSAKCINKKSKQNFKSLNNKTVVNCSTSTMSQTLKASPLKDSNRLNLYPKLDFEAPSPLRPSSPTKPDKIQQAPDALGKPPSRLSPFKGARANMTSSEIFATTPKRIFNSKTQSVDRHGFGKLVGEPFGGNTETNEITFGTLKRLAPSNMNSKLRTPSRMVKGRTRTLPNSEQPSRTGRPSLNINGKDVNTNLLGKFNSQNEIKPCLKMKGSSPEKPKDQNNDSDNDLTTSLNTMKNAENAKSVKAFLQSGDDAEMTQPRKKRRAVTFTSELNKIDESPGKDEDLQKMLKMVLENQRVIMNKLNQIEERLS